jgi:hypothetical protein
MSPRQHAVNSRRWRLAPIIAGDFLAVGAATRLILILEQLQRLRPTYWLLDWNVYYAAAIDLVQRDLYRIPLSEPRARLEVDVFNYPPLAAAWALPLIPLGRELGGLVWVLMGVAFAIAGLYLSARVLELRHPWLWVAAVWFFFSLLWSPVVGHIALGNNNDLMFLLAAGFVASHLSGHQRLAGVLLALAIATKLWPVALLVLVLRERRWTELRWTVGVLVAQGIAFLGWLGPDVLPLLFQAVVLNVPHDLLGQPVIWTTAFRVWWDWWPAWGTYVVAIVLVALPASGRLGVGLCILGGLALNANLWHHYVWVFLLGVALVVRGIDWRYLSSRTPGLRSARRSPVTRDAITAT